MLALHLGQRKSLDWPPASEAMPAWHPFIERMLALDVEMRPTLDEVGQLAAAMGESQHLEGVSVHVRYIYDMRHHSRMTMSSAGTSGGRCAPMSAHWTVDGALTCAGLRGKLRAYY